MKYFTYDQLLKFNRSSVKTGKNRNFNWRRVNKQVKVLAKELNREKEDLKFPVMTSMIHNDKELRTQIALGKDRVYLDVTFKQYALLDDDKNVKDTEFLI